MPPGRPEPQARPNVPSTMDQKPPADAGRTAPGGGTAMKDTQKNPLVGLAVFGSDGQKVGAVHDVKLETDGKVAEIHVRTGGFLGMGGRTVAVPSAKFTRAGTNVQLSMTSEDVTKLPRLDEKAG